MLSYYLKSRKNSGSKNLKVVKKKEEQGFHQVMQCVEAKNQDLLETKKQEGC